MLIVYDVSCFERELKIIFPDGYEIYVKEIGHVLDAAYDKWHHPEDIEDEEERKYVQDSCCEEFMMDELSLVFNQWEEWTSVYYGDDPEEMKYKIVWTVNNKKGDC
jgi:hypothetical protein